MSSALPSSIPVAFLLAMAVEQPGAPDGESIVSGPLQAGALSPLVNAPGNSASNPAAAPATERLVQYFPNFPNFRNCFAGAWRNC